jgi:hypothetical protein
MNSMMCVMRLSGIKSHSYAGRLIKRFITRVDKKSLEILYTKNYFRILRNLSFYFETCREISQQTFAKFREIELKISRNRLKFRNILRNKLIYHEIIEIARRSKTKIKFL